MQEHKATKTSTLPQYINSPLTTEKFLEALHDPQGEIQISSRYKGLKVIDADECLLDGLEYFTLNKKRLEKEFYSDCVDKIGKDNTHKYFDVISNIWYDGRGSRTGIDNYPLLSSIEKYFTNYKRISRDSIFVRNQPDFGTTEVLFEPDILDEIFKLNNRLTNFYLGEWLNQYYPRESFGVNGIYVRRGIVLDKSYDEEIFSDQNYLNSYTLSFTISEQFCQLGTGKPTIINIPYNSCLDRIFFFSPFIKNLNSDLVAKNYEQLELGLVPPYTKTIMKLQDEHDNVAEYMLEYLTPY
jgi:hypothetical protein